MIDATTSAAARDAGAALALGAEDHAFELQAAISRAARDHAEFSSDEVWTILEGWGVEALEHPNALGAQFLAASRAGIIEATDRSRRSARVTAHRRKVTLWRSLIHKAPAAPPQEIPS